MISRPRIFIGWLLSEVRRIVLSEHPAAAQDEYYRIRRGRLDILSGDTRKKRPGTLLQPYCRQPREVPPVAPAAGDPPGGKPKPEPATSPLRGCGARPASQGPPVPVFRCRGRNT